MADAREPDAQGHPRYTVEFSTVAAKALRRLPKTMLHRVSEVIDRLAEDPSPRGVKKLQGADDIFRVRVGDWRILYSIEDNVLIIWILDIAHRRDAYRRQQRRR